MEMCSPARWRGFNDSLLHPSLPPSPLTVVGFLASAGVADFPRFQPSHLPPHPGALLRDFILANFFISVAPPLPQPPASPLSVWITADPSPPLPSIVASYVNFWMGNPKDMLSVSSTSSPGVFCTSFSSPNVTNIVLRLQGIAHGGLLLRFHASMDLALAAAASLALGKRTPPVSFPKETGITSPAIPVPISEATDPSFLPDPVAPLSSPDDSASNPSSSVFTPPPRLPRRRFPFCISLDSHPGILPQPPFPPPFFRLPSVPLPQVMPSSAFTPVAPTSSSARCQQTPSSPPPLKPSFAAVAASPPKTPSPAMQNPSSSL